MSTRQNGRLTYAYAVLHRGARPPAGLLGIKNAPVRTVAEGPLAALVSEVPAAEFDQPGVRDRLEDLTWLEATARAHRRVVDETAAAVGVLPLRLVTVYRDEEAVRAALAEHTERFERLLNRLDGRLEWGVKAYAQDEEALPVGAGPVADGAGLPTDGLARAAHHALAKVAECSCVHSPQDACPAGAPPGAAAACATSAYWTSPIARAPYPHGRNLLDSAYLVPREAAGTFAETVGGLAARSPALRIELTGPWAPYSFTEPGRLPDFPG